VLTWKVFDVVRFLLNVPITTGQVYSSWADEILLTVPKVHGSSLLNDIRPIGLIELLRNAFFGIQYATIKDTWEDLELVSTTQYGAQRGIGTAEFRMMEVCIYETCYIYRLPVAKGNEDKRKAYDRPSHTGGYQMGSMRLAIPWELLVVDSKINILGRIHIRFAYGYAPVFKKAGLGSCGFGAAQGSEDGPDKYNAFEDPFNTWWEDQDMGITVKVSELKSVQLKGGGFVDDKAPISSLDDLRRWYMGSSLVLQVS